MATIFDDGFESGDTSAWDAVYQPDDLEVTAEAALEGSYGLKINESTTAPQVEADFDPQAHCQFALRFDPNGIEIIAGLGEIDPPYIEIFYADLGTVNVKKVDGSYYVFIEAYDDTYSVDATSADYLISDGPHLIEIEWQAATDESANDGFMSLSIDGASKETLEGLDNSIAIEFITIGHATPYFGDFTGSFYLDGFTSSSEEPEPEPTGCAFLPIFKGIWRMYPRGLIRV